MTPYASGKRWTLFRADALAVLSTLPDASADGLVTDPPYSSGGAFRGDRAGSANDKYLRSDSAQSEYLPTFAGDNRDQRTFGIWCALWLGECLRVVAPGRAAVMFCDWRQVATATDALQIGGWVYRGLLPWVKPNARPSMGRFAQSAEFAAWGTAGPSADDVSIGCPKGYSIANPPRGANREHVTQKPEETCGDFLALVPRGGLVLDPFAGSGSTGVAAVTRGLRFVGIEVTEENADIAARRLAQAESDGVQLGMFGG